MLSSPSSPGAISMKTKCCSSNTPLALLKTLKTMSNNDLKKATNWFAQDCYHPRKPPTEMEKNTRNRKEIKLRDQLLLFYIVPIKPNLILINRSSATTRLPQMPKVIPPSL